MHGRVAHDAFFPHALAARFKLRLYQRDNPPRRAQNSAQGGKDEPNGNEGYVHHAQGRRFGEVRRRQVARVGALHDGDARVVAQLPVQLAVAYVDGVHPPRARAQQHVGKAAGGRTHVHGHCVPDVKLKDLHGLLQLQPAAADIGERRAAHRQLVRGRNLLGRLARPLPAHEDAAGENQGLRFFPALRKPARDQRRIQPFLIVHAMPP